MNGSNTRKKFLILGATGQAGGHVAPRLLKRGEYVRCLVRSEEKAKVLRESGAEIAIGDLNDPGTLGRAFEGINSVFLVTAGSKRSSVNGAMSSGVSLLATASAICSPDTGPALNPYVPQPTSLRNPSTGLNPITGE